MSAMKANHYLIMVAGYPDLATAREDWVYLAERLRKKLFEVRDALLVSKDADGKPRVVETGNHLARQGAGWGVAIGILVGLVIPPILATAALGAAAGALIAKFADHELRTGLRHEVGKALEVGTAVVIVILPPESEVSVDRVLSRSPAKTVVAMDDSTIATIEAAITEEMKLVDVRVHAASADSSHAASADSSGTSS
jgi:uncharacterized membrane protein